MFPNLLLVAALPLGTNAVAEALRSESTGVRVTVEAAREEIRDAGAVTTDRDDGDRTNLGDKGGGSRSLDATETGMAEGDGAGVESSVLFDLEGEMLEAVATERRLAVELLREPLLAG